MRTFIVFVLVILSGTLHAQDPSLVLYFSFDDDAVDKATDHSQYRNNGAIEGSPQSVAGMFGSALMFDAIDDQVVVPTNATLDIEDEITMMAWAKPGPNLTADWRNIVGKSPTNNLGNNTFSYSIRSDNSGRMRFSLNLGSWQYVLGPTFVEDTWYHITGTYDGTILMLYVDGELVGTKRATGQINVTPDPVCVGNLVNACLGSQDEYWSGVIDEVRIWNKALSDEEVKQEMNQGKEDLTGIPIAWCREPTDGAMLESTSATLRWSPGTREISYDVYLGDSFDDVNGSTRDSDVFRGNQAATFYVTGSPGFAFPAGLLPGTTYYWRIDTVVARGTIHKGDVWSFTVIGLTARNPSPPHGSRNVSPNVELRWAAGLRAKSHEVYFGDNFSDVNDGTVGTYKGRTTNTSYIPGNLELQKVYYWRIVEVNDSRTWTGSVWNFKVRKETYNFDGRISREVLENYLSRAITMTYLMNKGRDFYQEQVRMVLNIGAKFLWRAFILSGKESKRIEDLEDNAWRVTALHALDPEIVVQGTIFEWITTDVNEVRIPPWVFEEFGLSQESRNFNYNDIIYRDGHYKDYWAVGNSVPDISRLETKMWFYYMARKYIDLGYEAIHVGNVRKMDDNDPEHEHWKDILTRIRNYASVHTRRHMVLIDGYCFSLKCGDNLLLDFHSFPMRPVETSTPEEAILMMGVGIYGNSGSGWTPSGWYATGGLPYVVELDHYGASGHEGENIPGNWVWGYDEISWFACQTEEYRNSWLRYAWQWVRDHDINGFVQMPGSRWLAVSPNDCRMYYANMRSPTMPSGYNQEETIKEIWHKISVEIPPVPPVPPVIIKEDFETGDFSIFDWTFPGYASWAVTSEEKNSGTYSAQVGSISDNESSTLRVELDCISGDISFYCKLYSESDFDYLKFYINGVKQDEWSGEQDWTKVSFPVTAGIRTFEWTYSKDGSTSIGSDTAWIDDIVFPIN